MTTAPLEIAFEPAVARWKVFAVGLVVGFIALGIFERAFHTWRWAGVTNLRAEASERAVIYLYQPVKLPDGTTTTRAALIDEMLKRAAAGK